MDEPYVPEMPSEIIQTAILDTLTAYDWDQTKLGMVPTIRLARRNYSQPEQYPCITIRWQEDAIRGDDADNGYMTPDETYVDMRLILEIEADALDEANDPTGFRVHSTLAFHSLRALKDVQGDLMANWADGVSDRGRTEDGDSTNDEGRFDQAIGVLYRVATENPSQLLARGMNA